jgi:hypothetical protein
MIVSLFSIGCLVLLSFLTGFFTFLYISSQLNQEEEIHCQFGPESKIGYKRNSINNNQLK